MRASDTDRQRVVDELLRHCRAGRLDLDEYGRRVEEATAAATLADLDHALRDLPLMRIEDPGSRSIVPRDGRASPRRAWVSAAAVGLGVGVVGAAVGLAAAGEVAWAVLLMIGWVIGLAEVWLLRWR